MVAILQSISQDDDQDDLEPEGTGRGPETEKVDKSTGGEETGQTQQKKYPRGIDRGPISQGVADVSPDLAVSADRPLGAIRQNPLYPKEHEEQRELHDRSSRKNQWRSENCNSNN
jgi:hypothetical protein